MVRSDCGAAQGRAGRMIILVLSQVYRDGHERARRLLHDVSPIRRAQIRRLPAGLSQGRDDSGSSRRFLLLIGAIAHSGSSPNIGALHFAAVAHHMLKKSLLSRKIPWRCSGLKICSSLTTLSGSRPRRPYRLFDLRRISILNIS